MKKHYLTLFLAGFVFLNPLNSRAEEKTKRVEVIDEDIREEVVEREREPVALKKDTVYKETMKPLLDSKSLKELREKLTLERAINFLSIYEPKDLKKLKSPEYYKKQSVHNHFINRWSGKIRDDPFNHYGESLEQGDFPYEEEALSAAWSVFIERYYLGRFTEASIKKAKQATTASHTTKQGTKFSLGPRMKKASLSKLEAYLVIKNGSSRLVIKGKRKKLKIGYGKYLEKLGGSFYIEIDPQKRNKKFTEEEQREWDWADQIDNCYLKICIEKPF